jgi:hypothetical protein
LAPWFEWIRYDDKAGEGFEQSLAAGFDVSLKTDDRANLELNHREEVLTRGFAIYRDVIVPAGRYERWEGAIIAATNPVRPWAGQGEFRAGGLYGGTHRLGRLELTWRPNAFVSLGAVWVSDRVHLPQARFAASVARLRLGLTANPRLRLDFLGQYESEIRSLGAGVRVRLDFREGTELILAWDAIEARDPLRGRESGERRRNDRGAVKFSYLVLF